MQCWLLSLRKSLSDTNYCFIDESSELVIIKIKCDCLIWIQLWKKYVKSLGHYFLIITIYSNCSIHYTFSYTVYFFLALSVCYVKFRSVSTVLIPLNLYFIHYSYADNSYSTIQTSWLKKPTSIWKSWDPSRHLSLHQNRSGWWPPVFQARQVLTQRSRPYFWEDSKIMVLNFSSQIKLVS